MAIENKWKSAATQPADNISFTESKITDKENTGSVSTRTDWTLQRKAGIAMGVVGVMLFVVGMAPMVLDSESLKGSVTNTPKATSVDPLIALLGGSGTQKPSTPAENDGELPEDLLGFGEHNTLGQAANADQMHNVVIPTTTPLPTIAAIANTTTDAMTAEVNDILSAEDINAGRNTPSMDTYRAPIAAPGAMATNTNTGTTDTQGAAFANGDTTPVSAAITAAQAQPVHGAAGLQNTSYGATSNTHLNESGPASTAILLFLLSAFATIAIRYRKEMF